MMFCIMLPIAHCMSLGIVFRNLSFLKRVSGETCSSQEELKELV